MFGFGGDGDMAFVEAVSAAGFLGAYVDEATRDSEKAEKKQKKRALKDDDEFVPVFQSGTSSLEEFWDMEIFGYKNFRDFYKHISPYWR